MKKFFTWTIAGCLMTAIFSSCSNDRNNPGRVYMPDMFYSQAFETYAQNNFFKDSMNARMPAKGSIPRGGYMPYKYENTAEGYELAGKEVMNPLKPDSMTLTEGKRLFGIYCAICHGEKGLADGPIVASGKFPPPPSYMSDNIKNLPEGKMFHSVTYGKNLMGSYAQQLDQEQRWKVITYIRTLQGNSESSDSSSTKAPAKIAAKAEAKPKNK